ncbi:mechanosensitive ion channel family protein [Pseudomarimonas salicorniae]|uniref:Mechanosensitive ion channel n=1 Tax=Pseudomarimonas salicorniae TaxID=2933270 RepID=A0ABT0GED7_9GAMM|nr:mechanosensitive ion channel [Lysobacter sp. CAU 1642]
MAGTAPAPAAGAPARQAEAAPAASEGLGDHVSWAWDLPLMQLGEVALTPGKLTLAALALLVAFLVSAILRRGLSRVESRSTDVNRRAALYAVGRIVHYTALIIGAILALELIGVPASRFAVFAGAIGVGLGFGLQAIFNNFVSGLILLFDRSLKVGDFVELESGVHGEVRDIQIRATRIVTNDNLDILVPNAEFVSGRVVNWTHRDVSRRLKVPFGVAYGSDKERVKKAALEAAAEVPFTLEQDGRRGPQVWLAGFGESSLDFELVVWLTAEATKRPGAVRAAYNWALESALARHGLEIPFPQRDLHVRSWLGRTDRPDAAANKEADTPSLPAELREELSRNDALVDAEGVSAKAAEEEREAAEEEQVPPERRPKDKESR